MSCRMNPARSSSRWLAASASAGSSRRVGMWSWDQRMPANAPWGRNVRRRPEDTCSRRRSQFDYRTRRPVAGLAHPGASRSGRYIWVRYLPVTEPRRKFALERQRLRVVALEHRDEQRQQQERVCPELEQRDVVVPAEGVAFGVGELQPGAALRRRAVQDHVRPLGLPPVHRAAGVLAVALDQFRVAVDRVEELVDQVLAHQEASGYQVK